MEPSELDALEAELDPAARYLVRLLRQSLDEMKAMLAERDAQNAQLAEQLAEMKLFGKRSEKLPPFESEVRRAVEAEELTVEGDPMPEEPSAKEHAGPSRSATSAIGRIDKLKREKAKLEHELLVARKLLDLTAPRRPGGPRGTSSARTCA